MQRQKATFLLEAEEIISFKSKMLNWAQPFSIFLFLDSNQYQLPHSKFECLLAVNARHFINGSSNEDVLSKIEVWQEENKDWLFGHIVYDFKNSIEPKLVSNHPQKHGWDDVSFFSPEIICYLQKDCKSFTIESIERLPEDIFEEIVNAELNEEPLLPKVKFKTRINKETYLKTIQKLRQHIEDGDCYEINFCCEGFVEEVNLNPSIVFNKLNQISPAPFAAFYRNKQDYLMCASPERYLMKEKEFIRSMPIKGTIKRGENELEDLSRKQALFDSEKDRAENVMIVDLVRNDLARSCVLGTVSVEELFGVYSFPQVHHLISTVTGELSAQHKATDAIRYSFPMGSMTGAPKMKVMELTDRYEQTRRELFSGSVGYFTPDGDFDFNVVIRSLFYNTTSKYLSYKTGGAITYDSNAEEEYEEMRLKAWALERIFDQKT